ncbi:DUF4232 domain-containing protein [Streptomyces sp. NPDC001177]
MNSRLRTALVVTAALGSALLMTACEGTDTSSAPAGASPSVTGAAGSAKGSGQANGKEANGNNSGSSSSGASTSSGASGKGTKSSTGKKSGTSGDPKSADNGGYTQSCGTNDISWSVTSETQAGGYFLIKAKAKPGISCVLPTGIPGVAFGSDGTEAKPAEQSAGQEITLRAGVTVYAGVNPKTTKDDWGKELDELIVSVSDNDPNPETLHVGKFVVAEPIVTDWHTSPADAVPFFQD